MNNEINRSGNVIKRRRVAAAVGILLASAAFAIGANKGAQGDEDVNPYAEMKTQVVNVGQGEGARSAIAEVNPEMTENAWKSEESIEELENLETYIEEQEGGLLQPGPVKVPIIPGQQ